MSVAASFASETVTLRLAIYLMSPNALSGLRHLRSDDQGLVHAHDGLVWDDVGLAGRL